MLPKRGPIRWHSLPYRTPWCPLSGLDHDLLSASPITKPSFWGHRASLGGSGELPDLLTSTLTLASGDPHACGGRRLVHIEPATPFDESIQIISLRSRSLFRRRREEPLS